MAAKNLPARVETIRQLFESPSLKKQLQMAIPRHMSVDRLLRVAMTAIRTNPALAECTQKSLLACIMGCATLGLEPEPFLGQAYLVPYSRKGVMECTLIPGYRGYIALARRSGEVQSVSAQVVYERDHFVIQYGLDEKLEHMPAEGDRGAPKGAYVIFRYRDGSYSFDYMSVEDIEKVRARSKAKDSGPWVTDWSEMAKKTVIRRHVKLVPLSVELVRAAALEEAANIGESQMDLLTAEVEDVADGEVVESQPLIDFDEMVKGRIQGDAKKEAGLVMFLQKTAELQKTDLETVRAEAIKNSDAFWKAFEAWYVKQATSKIGETKGRQVERPKDSGTVQKQDGKSGAVAIRSVECPNRPGETRTIDFCLKSCPVHEGCPALE